MLVPNSYIAQLPENHNKKIYSGFNYQRTTTRKYTVDLITREPQQENIQWI